MKDLGLFSFLWLLHAHTSGRTSRRKATPRRRVLRPERLEERVALDNNSAGPNGINATVLGLTGQGVTVGQVETGRPGMRTGGPRDNNANSHPDVTPAGVFLRNGPAVANQDITPHATEVAGVMIAS